jgi:hypothetical protein
MKKTLSLLVFLFFTIPVISQKQIHLMDNDSVINARKIKYKFTRGEVKYLPEGPSKSYKVKTFGQIDYLTINKNNYGITNSGLLKVKKDFFNNEATQRGALDACRYYTKYTGAATGTFVTTFLAGGIIGLIPAISTSSTTPKEKNLNMPDVPLKQEPDYKTAYQKQAKNIKSGKVWNNYAMGLLTAITLVFTLSMLTAAP